MIGAALAILAWLRSFRAPKNSLSHFSVRPVEGSVNKTSVLTILVIFALACLSLGQPANSTTSISFQGALDGPDGKPLPNGNYDLSFRFWDGPAPGGTAVSPNISVENVALTSGIVSTVIPIDPAWFDGQTRYLSVSVGGGSELLPRLLVTAVPYALSAQGFIGGDVKFIRQSDGRVVHRIITSEPPAEDLVIYASGGSTGMRFVSAGGSSDGFSFYLNSTPGWFGGTRPPTPVFRISTPVDEPQSSTRAFVGINIPNPENELHVGGSARITDDLVVHSTAYVGILQIRGGADLAEHLTVIEADEGQKMKVEPGMVVSIDPTGDRKFKLSDQPYDRKRVGIISGGNGLKPGLILRDEGNPEADGDHPVALTGQVWCHADASFGSIEPGDLLTTSSTPGHAMKVSDFEKARFAVLGQAITGLKHGRGWVQVLVGKQ